MAEPPLCFVIIAPKPDIASRMWLQPKEVSYNTVPKLTTHSNDVHLGVRSNYIIPFHLARGIGGK